MPRREYKHFFKLVTIFCPNCQAYYEGRDMMGGFLTEDEAIDYGAELHDELNLDCDNSALIIQAARYYKEAKTKGGAKVKANG